MTVRNTVTLLDLTGAAPYWIPIALSLFFTTTKTGLRQQHPTQNVCGHYMNLSQNVVSFKGTHQNGIFREIAQNVEVPQKVSTCHKKQRNHTLSM